MKICLDMDGTIADLYGVQNWLEFLRSEDTTPYRVAEPLVNMSVLARYLNRLQREGHEIVVISWLSKCGSPEYDEAVTETKKAWLKKHLKSVRFDAIHIVPYGYAKENFSSGADDVLFDDEEKNRVNWTGKAHDVNNILGILRSL